MTTTTLVDMLNADGHNVVHVAAVDGGEYAGPCPDCGGVDRFRVWPCKDKWWCRSCGASGDTIDYLREFRGMSFVDACRAIGREPGPLPSAPIRRCRPAWQPKTPVAPGDAWQSSARAFVDDSRRRLLDNDEVMTWLAVERGLVEQTVRAAGLGWNDRQQFVERAAWGLPPENNADGRAKKVWLPAGLVIPTTTAENDGKTTITGVRFRLDDADADQRYIAVAGVPVVPMVVGENRTAVVVVESALDAILIAQEAGDLVTAVALHSVTTKPDKRTWSLIQSAHTVLVALDADDAGAKAAWAWWRENLPTGKRWTVPAGAKDPTDAHLAGHDLRAWIEAGLPEIVEVIIGDETAQTPPATQTEVVETRSNQYTYTVNTAPKPAGSCYHCGSTRLWRSSHGAVGCPRCHPPVDEKGIEWITADAND
jgi:DNA primase